MDLLNKIQRELKAPKSQFNSFGKYNYRNCEDILEAVKPLLGANAAVILSDEMVQLGDRYYVKAKAELVVSDKVVASATAYAREPLDRKGMDESQITGAASSYARKYALNGLFCIDDTKDADTSDNTAKPIKPAVVAKAQSETATLKAEIKTLADKLATAPLFSADDYRAYIVGAAGLELHEKNYKEIISRLKAL